MFLQKYVIYIIKIFQNFNSKHIFCFKNLIIVTNTQNLLTSAINKMIYLLINLCSFFLIHKYMAKQIQLFQASRRLSGHFVTTFTKSSLGCTNLYVVHISYDGIRVRRRQSRNRCKTISNSQIHLLGVYNTPENGYAIP